MHSLILVALAAAVFPTLIYAQQSPSLLGKWSGTMSTAGGGELAVELSLSETAGTWRFVPKGSQGRNNPCLGKDFPVVVTTQSATELKFEVLGASVIQGCINAAAVLNLIEGKSLEGSLADGRIVKLAR
ncbi:MAG: hypothetical protein H7Z74_02405 [Anaerolineae bacterium]|nr:hypothetical protein [Gemmatimonadaceae bacterium]